MRDTMRLRLK